MAIFLRDKAGVSAVLIALMLPVLIGFVGLGIDTGMWYSRKREMQIMADSSAISAALSYMANGDSAAAVAMGKSDAIRSGFDNAEGVIDVAIADGKAIVSLTEPQGGYFSSMFLSEPVTIESRAIAGPVSSVDADGTYCMLGLDINLDKVVEFNGHSQGQIKCGVASNSVSANSLYMNGDALLQIDPADLAVKGQITKMGNATLETRNPPKLGDGATDPYTALTVPSGSCDHNNFQINNRADQTLTPGRYCNGLKLNNASNVTFRPGVYVIDEGTFQSSLSTSAQGNGVTFILTGDGGNYANMHFSGNSQMTFTAPDSGDYKGVLFYQDRASPSFVGGSQNLYKNQIVGGTQLELTGAMYFPAQELSFEGGAQMQSGDNCLQVIARKITFIGNFQVQSDLCTGSRLGDVRQIFGQTQMVRLVQ
ncbi:MAG: pilus assembly protein TadG-related protein [Alphaproteobacteria bacterium]